MKPETINRPPEPFPANEYAKRIEKLRKLLQKKDVDGAIITRDISRLYLTGFDSSAGTLLIDVNEGAIFVVDFRYILMAEKAMPFAKCVLQKSGAPSAVEKYTKKWKAAGFEQEESLATVERLKNRLSSITQWITVDGELSSLRSIKSPLEQKKMQQAVSQGDKLYSWVLPQIHEGMTEWELRNIFRKGADIFGHGESFDTIVCAGANGAECHHKPGLDIIEKNSPILMDFGIILDHYHSDLTRCISLGKPTALYKKIFSIVLEANQKAIQALKPGMTGEEVDAIARTHIAKAGYGDAFGHSLGHSVGMEIHEGPNFSPNEKRIIRPGMIITVEPGIYLPGKLGVRIEDVVLITKTGCKVMSQAPH